MKRKYETGNKIILTVLCLAITFLLAQFSLAQDPARKPRPKTGFNPFQMDSRAKELTYHFKDTDEDMKYCLFVSSKVNKNKKRLSLFLCTVWVQVRQSWFQSRR